MPAVDDAVGATVRDPRHAVVIEDDPDVAGLLTMILVQAGFLPVVATDGVSGIEEVRRHAPAITTVDVAMPGLDGLETTRRIREFSSTYVVMVSALSGEADILGGFAAGADDYVAKPFRPRELRSRLSAGLRRPGHRIAAHPPRVAVVAPQAPPAPAAGEHGGVEFAGEWIGFRGLRLNPSLRALTVAGRPLAVGPFEIDLLELLLYADTRSRSATELALSLRGEPYAAGSLIRDADLRRVRDAMAALLGHLDEDPRSPRWIEVTPEGDYRLALGSS